MALLNILYWDCSLVIPHINVAQVPFMVDLGIINTEWIVISLQMMPIAVVATMIAPLIVKHINQKLFETLLWLFVVFAGLKLLA